MESNVLTSERAFLEKVYHTYTNDTSSQSRVMRELTTRIFTPYLGKSKVGLELGCSDGFMTEILAANLERLDVVDGSKTFLAEASKRELPNVKFIQALFEEFKTATRYDCIFATYILEHVLDPIEVMSMARGLLKPEGLLMIVVPNARALSRQLALHMGLLKDLKELTPNDHNHGHRRVYDRVNLDRDIAAAGFEIVAQGGIMLKILADFQMDKLIDDGMLGQPQLDGLYKLGLEYPDLTGSLYAICRAKRSAGTNGR